MTAPTPSAASLRATAWSVVGNPEVRATVHGVHGAEGRTHWKAFAGRRQLQSPTEAIEWASIPPGGVSGEHLHTRTEELYLLLSGSGDLLLNGVAHPVRTGSLALTGVGSVHGLRNTGDTVLDWWVIETLPPATRAALSGEWPIQGGGAMNSAVVFDLFEQKSVDTAGIFTGPMRHIDLVDLPAASLTTIGRPDAELAVYVHAGEGEVSQDGPGAAGATRLTADTCLLLPAGSRAEFSADSDLRMTVVTLAVEAQGAGG